MRTRFSPLRLFAELLVIIGLAELCVMLVLPLIAPGVSGMYEDVLDVALLSLMSAPLMYWRIMTFVQHNRGVRTESPPVQRISSRNALVMVSVAQLVGLSLTAAAVLWQRDNLNGIAQNRFDRATERFKDEVIRRMGMPVYGLKGARGAFAVRGRLDRLAFKDYMSARDLSSEFPGVRGIGFIEPVKRADLAAFVARERSDHAPGFKVLDGGGSADLLVIKYIEPLALNRADWGYDIVQDAVFLEAADMARLSGDITLSGRVLLRQTNSTTPGLYYLLPVYASAHALGGADRGNLLGYFSAPLVVAQLMAGVEGVSDEALEFALFDGESTSEDSLLYRNAHEKHDLAGALTQTRSFEMAGRMFTLQVQSTPAFEAAQDRTVLALIGVGGTLLSTALAFGIWMLAVGRMRALRLAQRMTQDMQRLAQVVQNTNNAVTLADADMRITWVNDAFTRMTGYTLEEAKGRTPGELLGSGKADAAAIAALNEGIAKEQACRVQILNRAKDGREYWVDTEVQPTRDEQGTLVGFMELGTDITLLIETQKQMHAMAERMTMAAEGGSDGLWDWMDINEDAQWWSPSYYAMLGFTPEEMPSASSSYIKLLHPDFINESLQAGQDAFAGIRNFDLELQMRTRDQGYRWFRTRAKVFRDAQGNPIRMSGSTQDIHERKLAQAEAQKAFSILRNSIEALDDAFVLFDENDRLVMCNQRYKEFYPDSAVIMEPGITFEEIVRFGVQKQQYPDSVGREEEWVTERMALHRQPYSSQVRTTRDGRTLRVVDRRTPDGYTVGFRADVTDLVSATRVAEEASIAKSQFLANMSHEIRTPMNAILGLLQLLQNTELGHLQRDYVQKTEGAARSLLGLLNDILDFSKVEAGKMTLDLRPFRIDRLLRDLSVILSANVGKKPVEVLFDIDPQLPACVVGDDLRLQQVLINLGGNAIKFTSRGEVVLGLRMVERGAHDVLLEFSVKDSGIGIAPENQARIFSGFSQAESNITRRFGGTGLGLSISSRLTALMGGTLRVDSVLGQGSTFSFQIRLPIDSTVADAPAADLPAQLRTLVVDDNPVAREVLSHMVQSLGWQADVAADGAEALAKVQDRIQHNQPYQAIFMDWQMPGMDGWQASASIRSLQGIEGATTTPVPPLLMMVSAHGRELLAQRSAQDQALLNGFLVKPVTASMLADAVHDALQAAQRGPGAAPAKAFAASVSAKRLAGLRLLVVEDNKINQMVAQGLLSREGADITLADDGQLGVDAVAHAEAPFDAVLMDLQMPVMDGFTATHAIRKQLGLTDLPIIAMTANAMASDRAACLAAGMNDHVGKPFELDHLVAVLLQHTGRPAFAPSAVAAAPVSEVPAIEPVEGMQLPQALARMGGNTAMYAQALQTFVDELPGKPQELAHLLAQGAAQEAVRMLHTLKGLSATVGASALSHTVAQLEKTCKTPLASASITVVVAQLQEAVADAVGRITPVLQRMAPSPAPQVHAMALPVDQILLQQELEALALLLRNFDMTAMDAHMQIQQRFGAALPTRLQPLREAMDRLDFAAALLACEGLIAQPS